MKEINVGKMIILKRKEKKITQDELAKYIGVSKAAISKWETGQSYPDITLLPILAAYFNMSIDELIGYEPQMVKEDIQKLYVRLCEDFAKKPFEEVILECEELIKKYYSCFPLLHQMGLLLINHSMLAPDVLETTRLNELACSLFERVKEKGDDVELSKQALHLEAYCYLLLNQPSVALELLEDTKKPKVSSEVLIAQAHQMLGQIEEAKSSIQVGVFSHLMEIFQTLPILLGLSLPDQKRFEDIIQKIETLDELFEIKKVNPYPILPIQLMIAQGYMQLGEAGLALDYLDAYSKLATDSIQRIKIQGNDFFNLVEDWFKAYEIGQPPRNEAIIKQSALDGVLKNPVFMPLHEEERFINLVARLKFYL